MDVEDYVIDQESANWSELTADWTWLLPERFDVWLVNRLGDLLLVLPDGAVHFLDVGAGTLERIADDRGHFDELIEDGDNANDWLAVEVVDDCVASGMTLAAGECYGYRQLPALGGSDRPENLVPIELALQLALAGQIHRQVRDLEDGTEIQIDLE